MHPSLLESSNRSGLPAPHDRTGLSGTRSWFEDVVLAGEYELEGVGRCCEPLRRMHHLPKIGSVLPPKPCSSRQSNCLGCRLNSIENLKHGHGHGPVRPTLAIKGQSPVYGTQAKRLPHQSEQQQSSAACPREVKRNPPLALQGESEIATLHLPFSFLFTITSLSP
ncbi:hypothetical protein IE81DRAFT_54162 [Ceraceosorus guamensis]|uniref:Uncharacterized protein n=1 Tax=Ceraceosorus guamensis TaxID=1522189 RepID=A0A316W383_9BASI|nr:hypothetical protein IE81DRAFT_54162 [Ceraceosorus guamensis]PWN43964.1 hypothetical protein IE81DRAFT_54162 [Ceraceosorus guamensis]